MKKNRADKYGLTLFPILMIIVFVFLVMIFILWSIGSINKSFKTDYAFYKDNCPKFGASVVEPREGYIWTRLCFKETNNETRFYYLGYVNKELKMIPYEPVN